MRFRSASIRRAMLSTFQTVVEVSSLVRICPGRQHEVVADRRMSIRVVVGGQSAVGDEAVEIGPVGGVAHDSGIALIFFHHYNDVLALRG